jgi:hypothetical protein
LIERSLDDGDTSAVRTLLALAEVVRTEEPGMNRLFGKAFELVRRQPKEADRDAPEQLLLLADLIEKERPGATRDEETESAERIAREVLALRRAAHPAGAPKVTASLLRLADLLDLKADRLRRRGDAASAAAVYWEARSFAREAGAGSECRVAEIESALGRCLTGLGRFEEAERLLTESARVLQSARGDRYATTQAAMNGLVGLYEAWGKPGEAARYRTSLPPISVGAVRDVGRVRFPPEVLRRKGGLSAPIGGRSVWVFQDTLAFGRGGTSPMRIDSSWGAVEAAASGGPPTVTGPVYDDTGAPAELIPRTSAETGGHWILEPGAAVWDKARSRALVFYSKRREEGREIRRAGSSIAVWPRQDAPAQRPVLRPGAEDPSLLFDAGEPAWGSGALVVGDWLYAYACEQAKNRFAIPCLLARAPLDRALDRRAWRFHARGSWVADWRTAAPVVDAGVLMSVARNGYLGQYVAMYTPILSSQIFVRTADRPEGPWSQEIIIEGIPPAVGFPWIASGVGHPELAREGGRVELLTYARHLLAAGSEMRAVEIEFRKR